MDLWLFYLRVTKYSVRITKPGVNAFFERVFIISFFLHEFCKNVTPKAKKVVMLT